MRLYNSLTREKEEFRPIKEGQVSMYSCGPTVYNFFHIGNARPFIIFDTLRRYLEYKGYKVSFVQNFTDVDDKMINKAKEENITVAVLADRYIAEYFTDARGLGIADATVQPKATENIDAIIEMVQKLIENGYAYEIEGDVYFDIAKFKQYGKLSHQPLEDLEMGARIDIDERKHGPMDFALWKKRKYDYEIAWESPWGMGRPGWHIECSAMACRYLGETIDIHSGGKDLIFPHHENEIAQSEAANGKPFANYWLHNGYINIDNRKMSKSLGNFFTVRDVAKEFGYEAVRFFMLSAHYRNPINFSKDLMEQAKTSLGRLENCIKNLTFLADKTDLQDSTAEENEYLDYLEKYHTAFNAAMDDDLNTADAISVLFDMARDINTHVAQGTFSKAFLNAVKEKFQALGAVLGLLKTEAKQEFSDEILALVDQRQQARAQKDFALSDQIRDQLLAQGIALKDTPQGVKISHVD